MPSQRKHLSDRWMWLYSENTEANGIWINFGILLQMAGVLNPIDFVELVQLLLVLFKSELVLLGGFDLSFQTTALYQISSRPLALIHSLQNEI